MIPECLGVVDDLLEDLLLFWLEGKVRNVVVPVDQLLKPRPGRVPWDPDAMVTDGTGPRRLVVVLYLAPRDLEALSVIPNRLVVLANAAH